MRCRVNSHDVRYLNNLIYLEALNSLYFSDLENYMSEIERFKFMLNLRSTPKYRVNVAVPDGNKNPRIQKYRVVDKGKRCEQPTLLNA